MWVWRRNTQKKCSVLHYLCEKVPIFSDFTGKFRFSFRYKVTVIFENLKFQMLVSHLGHPTRCRKTVTDPHVQRLRRFWGHIWSKYGKSTTSRFGPMGPIEMQAPTLNPRGSKTGGSYRQCRTVNPTWVHIWDTPKARSINSVWRSHATTPIKSGYEKWGGWLPPSP